MLYTCAEAPECAEASGLGRPVSSWPHANTAAALRQVRLGTRRSLASLIMSLTIAAAASGENRGPLDCDEPHAVPMGATNATTRYPPRLAASLNTSRAT